MVVFFLTVWTLFTPSVRANPMLDRCLPLAPQACALTEKSARADYLKCFETVELHLAKPAEAICAEELFHAKVHVACDETDIPQLCGKVKPGENRVMSCLHRQHEKLSKPCSEALERYDQLTGGSKKKGRHNAVSAVRC